MTASPSHNRVTSRAWMAIGRGLSLLGAVVVGGGAVLFGIAAVVQILEGVDGLSSADGLTRILSPILIGVGLLFATLAGSALAGCWRTARSRGRRQRAVLVAGLLASLGAALTYAFQPPAYQMLPALAFPLAAIGTGAATGGWVLGWTDGSVAQRATALRSLGAACALAAMTLPLAVGTLMARSAAESAEAVVPHADRARLLDVAHDVWNTPFHRMAYLNIAVTWERESVRCGTSHRLEAFTLFGLRPDYLNIDECGVHLR